MTKNSLRDMIHFYDNTSDNFSFSTPLYTDLIQSHTTASSHILDFGCGYGRVLDDLRKKGYKNLYGIDASKKLIDRALKDNPCIHYSHSTNIDYFCRPFDCIILNNVLVNICFEKDQDDLLKQAISLLSKRGKIIIMDFKISSHKKYLESYEKNFSLHGEYGIYDKKGCLFKHNSIERIQKMRNCLGSTEYFENVVSSLGGSNLDQFIIVGQV